MFIFKFLFLENIKKTFPFLFQLLLLFRWWRAVDAVYYELKLHLKGFIYEVLLTFSSWCLFFLLITEVSEFIARRKNATQTVQVESEWIKLVCPTFSLYFNQIRTILSNHISVSMNLNIQMTIMGVTYHSDYIWGLLLRREF